MTDQRQIKLGVKLSPPAALFAYGLTKLFHLEADDIVFLGLRSRDVMAESDLEDALLDHLQDFLLEMGQGLCFEARQKRILIGDEHFFVDLVFYHRVLKCHVLVELKTQAFSHENLGQLNTYVAYYKKHELATSRPSVYSSARARTKPLLNSPSATCQIKENSFSHHHHRGGSMGGIWKFCREP